MDVLGLGLIPLGPSYPSTTKWGQRVKTCGKTPACWACWVLHGCFLPMWALPSTVLAPPFCRFPPWSNGSARATEGS